MNKKIFLSIIAALVLFSLYFILAETITKANINEYLDPKKSFDDNDLVNVQDYLLKIEDLENSKDYQLGKKYLKSIEEVKVGSKDKVIAEKYYSKILSGKEFTIESNFNIKDGKIETILSSISESDLQKLALREDIKGIKITSLGEIELIQKIGEEELSLKLGENLRFAEFISKESFRLESKDPLKESKFEFNGRTYYGNKFLVTKIPKGTRLQIITPKETKNHVTFGDHDLEFKSRYLVEELEKKPKPSPERKLVITETLTGIKSITATNLDVNSKNLNGYSRYNAKLIFSKTPEGHMEIVLDNENVVPEDIKPDKIPNKLTYHGKTVYNTVPKLQMKVIIPRGVIDKDELIKEENTLVVLEKDRDEVWLNKRGANFYHELSGITVETLSNDFLSEVTFRKKELKVDLSRINEEKQKDNLYLKELPVKVKEDLNVPVRILTFPNRNIVQITIWKDGRESRLFSNGRVVEVYPDGEVIEIKPIGREDLENLDIDIRDFE